MPDAKAKHLSAISPFNDIAYISISSVFNRECQFPQPVLFFRIVLFMTELVHSVAGIRLNDYDDHW